MSLSDDEVRFSVEDDGRGFEAAAAAANGPGLVSMRERAAPIGGQLELRSELAASAFYAQPARTFDELEHERLPRARGRRC